jgi:type III pantothenate kinase
MKLFVVNIGNTNTQYAVYSEKKFENFKTCPTSDLSRDIIPDEQMPILVASAVPEKDEIVKSDHTFFLTPETETVLDFSHVDNSSMGPDRIANAVALANFSKLPAICIDCGTAITFEVVDADYIFRGGAILPGRKMLRRALNHFTAKIPLSQKISAKSPSALGRNTLDAIMSGCDIGVLGSVQKIIKKIKIELGDEHCQVIATGGDADFFADNLIEVSYGGADYTLRGLVAAWKYIQQKKMETSDDCSD